MVRGRKVRVPRRIRGDALRGASGIDGHAGAQATRLAFVRRYASDSRRVASKISQSPVVESTFPIDLADWVAITGANRRQGIGVTPGRLPVE